ncbi:cation diffusion facilitator family transporter [Salinicoccus hispanicus]|uniref:Cation diffusion facilitator family transporter n=1 Tax=Salinicoccus hispanicus TaxID=157225 RepID=A0A6N8U217_9STAP|nr:cation diffusion facilitator family transporter [Salinicoccus hispanicus]MXQ52114.1 cation diffusion facilitator family transporter [Salinicoccus hispanicus]
MNNNNAQKLIMISIIGALAFAALGIFWGILADSQMIQFDGYYSFISVLLSVLSMLALRFISKEDEKRFPFGKESFIPLTIVIKYVGILMLILISLVQALGALFSGGNVMSMSTGIAYALISTIGCYAAYFYFRSRGQGNEIISAEMNQWRMDALLSAGVLAGFVIGWGLSFTPLDIFVPYVDPLMVVVVAGYFIKVPLLEMYTALRELLEMAPRHQISEQVEAEVESLSLRHAFEDYALRLQKMGPKLYIEIEFIVALEEDLRISEQDKIRHELKKSLKELTLDPWITVVFTHEQQK